MTSMRITFCAKRKCARRSVDLLSARQMWIPTNILKNMGKFSQYSKRGSAPGTGFLQAPRAVDWHLAGPGATSVNAHRDTNIPAGADAWATMIQLASTRAIVFTSAATSATPINNTTLVTLTNYLARAAWFKGTLQVSDWSDVIAFTTT